MEVRTEPADDSDPGLLPLLDVTGVSLADLAGSEDRVLTRSIRERVESVDNDRNPVLSAFDSFLSS